MKTKNPNQGTKPVEAGAGNARPWKRRQANLVDLIVTQGLLDYVRAEMQDFQARNPDLHARLLALAEDGPKGDVKKIEEGRER